MLALPGVIGALVVALLATGCSAASKSVDPTQDRKAMMEIAANWYVASYGTLDLNGVKATVYDPGNILGLATATPVPASEPRTAISWRWDGSNIVMSAPSQDTTITLTNSAATPKNVDLRD